MNVIQLETAVGAAMKCFKGAVGVNVPRSRWVYSNTLLVIVLKWPKKIAVVHIPLKVVFFTISNNGTKGSNLELNKNPIFCPCILF